MLNGKFSTRGFVSVLVVCVGFAIGGDCGGRGGSGLLWVCVKWEDDGENDGVKKGKS